MCEQQAQALLMEIAALQRGLEAAERRIEALQAEVTELKQKVDEHSDNLSLLNYQVNPSLDD